MSNDGVGRHDHWTLISPGGVRVGGKAQRSNQVVVQLHHYPKSPTTLWGGTLETDGKLFEILIGHIHRADHKKVTHLLVLTVDWHGSQPIHGALPIRQLLLSHSVSE